MADLQKVISGLECCLRRDELNCIENCRYYTVEGHNAHRCWIPLNRDALELLKAQEPVRRGYWIPEPDRYYHWHCSECGFTQGANTLVSLYCPNCGAKMDGGEESDG